MPFSNHAPIVRILSANGQWAEDVKKAEPEFFQQTTKGQSPHILWIGCADSRVPESVVTGSRPGEIFVHRNIANQFHLDDASAASVITYAVNHLGVEHVVVVGHTECGGAAACFAAASAPSFTPGKPATVDSSLAVDAPLNRWLTPLTNLAASLQLSETPKAEALQLLVDENVRIQVENLKQDPTIKSAWKNKSPQGKDVWIHGWVYDLGVGKLRDLGVSYGPP